MIPTADPKGIKPGKYIDIYFTETMEVLEAGKIDKRVKAEFIAEQFPEDYGWGYSLGSKRRLIS